MELKIKRLTDKAVLPIRAHKSDAGLDLTAVDITLESNECGQTVVVYHSGLAVEIPEGHVGLLFPRSSIANKSMFMTNGVGVIDAGYRGEIMAKMHITTDGKPAIHQLGERFAQLVVMPIPEITVVEATELSNTDRGNGGYGSSDTTMVSAPSTDDEINQTEDTIKNHDEVSAGVDQTVAEEAAESGSDSEAV
jgi:dUTP diphosphatase